ncbi:MAG: thiolase family protein [Deltaproteobacteria bacterium]|nr:MAG: thiolase family protein [Deltaproteobacteria bacterium]
MREAVIVASARTPLGKSYRGALNATRPDDMASTAIKGALAQVPQLPIEEIEDIICGCGLPEGPSGMNVARVAALGAGLPETIAATTVNRFCSSGLQAIAMAAHQIMHEGANAAIGAGTESISMVQGQQNMNNLVNDKVREMWPGIYMGMGQTAEVVAERYKISREDQDEYALLSQQRTAAGQREGKFKNDIIPMHVKKAVKGADGSLAFEDVDIAQDECNRPDTTLEGLAKLKPSFKEDGTVTAGNASQLSDGASATILMSRERAKELGIEPLGVFRGFAVAGCRPEEMGIGPVFAVPKLLKRHGLTMKDIDIVELNEAFASQLLYCQRRLEIPDDKLNPLGGSISIGHPYGMTGSRMTGQLLRELRRQKKRLGLVTMCIGGGMGMAGLFEAC